MAKWVVGLAALVALPGLVVLPAWADDDQVLFQFRSGTAPNEVGIVPGAEDVEPSGPAALTIGDDGTVYVLDQNNERVIAVSPERSGQAPQILALPPDLPAADLAIVRNELFLWADGVVAVEKTGEPDAPERALRVVSGDADSYTRSALAAMGSQPPGPLDGLFDEIGRSANRDDSRPTVVQYVPSRGLGDVVAEVDVLHGREARIAIRRGGEEAAFVLLDARTRDRIGTVEVLDIDTTGRPYVLIETVPDNEATDAAMFVVRFSPSGETEAAYDVPLEPGATFSRRFVSVGPRGDVLFLRSDTARADVLRLASRPTAPGDVLAGVAPKRKPASVKQGKAPKMAIRPTGRESVVERAVAFETARWTVNPAAYGKDPAPRCPNMNRVQRPLYLKGKLNQDVKGIPYCWGCKTSVDAFYEGLEKGLTAGNVCTHSAVRTKVMGVDCSAFVSEVWGLARHVTTAAMPTITQRIKDPMTLRPGDALNKPGSHVMLFLRFTADRKVEVMEASPNACSGRVCRNVYLLSTLLRRGYQPVRLKVMGAS
ncbi:hypothetical protein [Chthonobacter albigriseus]|uniref:hypothetical protein n=1 Tax=Chthonobacter albigriseus TaxID=1683161 RepID=UPI0015EEBDBD|nr:hypothetical protein [Chthonobacter albigriseus]